ncbi:hypothetical protein [Streptomyces sp. NPDC008125]|uniref:hypothetical protein n=1 Tax=Streptomyces sp. NPDC008125 TaxID=3364811 RepID=UPI0036ED9709
MTTVFDQFGCRITEVTVQLTAHNIPLTAPPAPAADLDPTDPWASTYVAPIDRSTLAWCTAAQMLATHHHTTVDRQVLAADALLRELGVPGLAQLYSDLHDGAPIDYRYTPCPYCSGIGEDPTQPTCRDVGCPPQYEYAGHDHLCPVCHGADHQPEWFTEQHLKELDALLVAAVVPGVGYWAARWNRWRPTRPTPSMQVGNRI